MKPKHLLWIDLARALALAGSSLLTVSLPQAFGAPVNSATATATVRNWLRHTPAPLGEPLGARVKSVQSFPDKSGRVLYHVVALAPSGFVIVSGDDGMEPIIAFAAQGQYDPSEANPLGAIVSRDLPARMARALAQSKDAAVLQNRAQWARVLAPSSTSQIWVAPLLQSTWDQATIENLGYVACYNYFTPPNNPGNISNFVCGCVATGMAQVMRYFAFPAKGVGTDSFAFFVDDQPTNASTLGGNGHGGPYDWSEMPLSPDGSATTTQCRAIGALTYDAGLSVSMDYDQGGSGESGAYGYLIAPALTGTFGFANAIDGELDDEFGTADGANLVNMINPNLDAHLPVMLSIRTDSAGHLPVCDGYGYDHTTIYYHLNLGWSGLNNAWYALPVVDVGADNLYTILNGCTYNVFTSGTGEIISGRVLSTNGAPVAQATVIATRAGGKTTKATTDTNGIYALLHVPSNSSNLVTVSHGGLAASGSFTTGESMGGTNDCGNVWGADFVLGEKGPVIVTQPDNQFAPVGGAVAFSVSAAGSPPLSYQWQFDGTNAEVSGAQSNVLVLSNLESAMAGSYQVVVSNGSGAVASSVATLSVGGMGSLIPASEYQALLDLYNSTGGDYWNSNDGWTDPTAASWYGVALTGGHVAALELSDNNLGGTLPESLGNLGQLGSLVLLSNDLSGDIPDSLGGLSGLALLDLTENGFSDGIPASLGNLTNLEYLYLGGNSLSGALPDELTNMAALQIMEVWSNNLDGELPTGLDRLAQLQGLYLEANNLTGILPSSLGTLSNLNFLDLRDNQLTGGIPSSLGQLSHLSGLYLYGNNLTGPIPASLGNIASLTYLDLRDNQLTGSIPASLGNLSHLAYLYLYDNNLTGPIPASLGNLTSLTYLDLRQNQLTGEIPASLGNLSHLQNLVFYSNNLTGSIPSSLGNLGDLLELALEVNNLSGGIPSTLGNLSNLTYLDLRGNELTGGIPGQLAKLSQLQFLYLYSNSLSGVIPDLSALPALENFYLDNNNFDLTSDSIGIKNMTAINNMENAGQNVRYDPQNSPTIIAQSANVTNSLGSAVKFSVTATGPPQLTYQWQFDGAAIDGATNSVLDLSHLQLTEAGTYNVLVSNPYNTVTGPNVILTIPVPSPVITGPAGGFQTTNGMLTVKGTAAGNGLTAVVYQLNGGLPQIADSTNQWTNWTASSLSLAPGTNIFSVVADGPYSASAMVTNRYIFIVTSQLTLLTNGFGKIAPNLNDQFLDVGQSYTVTAVPAARNIFVDWSGVNNSTSTVLTFVMQSNMILEANFGTNIFLPLAGTYNGLFSVGTNVTEETAGMLSDLVLKTNGAYSAKLLIAGTNYSLSGAFDSLGALHTNVFRPLLQGGPLTLNLASASAASALSITGSVGGTNAGGWLAELAALPSGNQTAAAQYTMLVPSELTNDSPPGTGYAIITNSAGNLALGGALADGTPFNQSVPLCSGGAFPLYASLYHQTGLLFGWINLAGETPGGSITWLKQASSATPLYTGGFTNNVQAFASRWTNPPSVAATLALQAGQLTISGGDLATPLLFLVAVSNNNTLAKLKGSPTNFLAASINPKSGLLTVVFGNGTGAGTNSGIGAVLQNASAAAGFFTTSTNAGSIYLH